MKFPTLLFLLLALFSITAFCQPTTNSSASNHLTVRQSTSDFHTWGNLFGHGQFCFYWCKKSNSKGNNNSNEKKSSPLTEYSASGETSKRDVPLFNIGHVTYSAKLTWHKGLLHRSWDFLENQTGSTFKSSNVKYDAAKRYAATEAHSGEEHLTPAATPSSVMLASITNPHSSVPTVSSLLWDNSSTTAVVTATSTSSNATTSGGRFTPTFTSTPPTPSSSNGEKNLCGALTVFGGLIFWAGGQLLI